MLLQRVGQSYPARQHFQQSSFAIGAANTWLCMIIPALLPCCHHGLITELCDCRCGPCKVIYPTLQKMAQDQQNVIFVKLNCNKYNKDLGKQLGAP